MDCAAALVDGVWLEVPPTVALGFGEELVCDWPFNVGVTDAVLFDVQLVYFDVESDAWLEDALDSVFTDELVTMVVTVKGLPDVWENDEPPDDGFAGDGDCAVDCERKDDAAADDGDGDDDNGGAFGDDTEDELELVTVGDDVLCGSCCVVFCCCDCCDW